MGGGLMGERVYLVFAGWRCIVGGVVLVLVGDGVYRTSLIDVSHFQGDAFARKDYVREGLQLLPSLLQDMEVRAMEVVVERVRPLGYAVRDALRAMGYRAPTAAWWRLPYDVRFLAMIPFVQHLRMLGVSAGEVDAKLLAERPWVAHRRLVAWLKDGNLNRRGVLPSRERVAKTGWTTYALWALLPYREAQAQVRAKRTRRKVAGAQGGAQFRSP